MLCSTQSRGLFKIGATLTFTDIMGAMPWIGSINILRTVLFHLTDQVISGTAICVPLDCSISRYRKEITLLESSQN